MRRKGDGQIFDLYSLQDAIAEAEIPGYHGFGSRLSALLGSLRTVAAADPDILVPARGPVIRGPQEAIDRLTDRIHALYAQYLSTDALRFHFGEVLSRKRSRWWTS